jgi:hypothetical protein
MVALDSGRIDAQKLRAKPEFELVVNSEYILQVLQFCGFRPLYGKRDPKRD